MSSSLFLLTAGLLLAHTSATPPDPGVASRASAAITNSDEGAPYEGAPPQRSRHALSYSVAFEVSQLRDDLLRPLAFSGAGPGFDLGYRYLAPRWELRSQLQLDLLLLGNDIAGRAIALVPGTHATALFVAFERASFRLLIGGTYRYRSVIEYFPDWDDSFLYWMTAHAIGPTVRATFPRFPAGELSAELEIPLLGVLARPSEFRDNKVDPLTTPGRYIAYAHQNPELAHPGTYASPRLNLHWALVRGRHFQLGVGLALWFTRASSDREDSPGNFREFSQRLAVEALHVF